MRDPSRAIQSMPRSGIRAVFDLAAGIPGAIRLEVGQPDFTTAKHICDAADQAAQAGLTGYTPNAGIFELREALADKVRERNSLDVSPDQIVVTTGAGNALYTTLLTLVNPGDEVLLSDPGWPNYAMMLLVLGIVPVYFPLRAEDEWVPKAEIVERYISNKTKALIINSPSNPTGTIIERSELADLVDLAGQRDLWVISDEVYDEMTFDKEAVSTATLDPDGGVVSIFSFSKTYAMTGWRVGYAVTPPNLSELVTKAQEPITSCVNGPAQMAALAALEGPQDVVEEMRAAYHQRRDHLVKLLDDAQVPMVKPQGAFYAWIDISASGLSDEEFAHRLILDRHVAVVPGTTFGPDSAKHVRVSLATAEDELLEGVRRLADAVHDWGGTH